VAIIVAVLMLALCVMAAIVLDFGLAYNNKTQAQSAADAGALAAGKVYADARAKCDPKLDTIVGGVYADAYAAAEDVRKSSMPGSDPGALTVKCDKTDSTVKVSYDVPAKSPVGLGSFIIGDHMDLERHAAVKWAISEQAVGSLIPWMICGAQVPEPFVADQIVEIGLPGNGHAPAPNTCGVDQPGDWWRLNCPNVKNASNADSFNAVLNGCPTVTIVPGTVGLTDKVTRTHVLLGRCNTAYTAPSWTYPPDKNKYISGPTVTDCLARDTGRDVKNMAPAWDKWIGKTVAMPIFCADEKCTPSSVVTGEAKATWPVWKMAAVTVCGYALHGVYSPSTLPQGDCNNANALTHFKPQDFASGDIGFILVFKALIESGDAGSFPVDTQTTMRLVE